MGGIPQLLDMLAIALAILVVMFLLAFFVGKLFRSNRTRKWILRGLSPSMFLHSSLISASLRSFSVEI